MMQASLLAPVADPAAGQVGRGAQETWNLCSRLWRPSFLWLIFTGPGGAWPLRRPPRIRYWALRVNGLVVSLAYHIPFSRNIRSVVWRALEKPHPPQYDPQNSFSSCINLNRFSISENLGTFKMETISVNTLWHFMRVAWRYRETCNSGKKSCGIGKRNFYYCYILRDPGLRYSITNWATGMSKCSKMTLELFLLL